MCPEEQQTSDNLIVKDYFFIIEIFDKFSFSSILRGCLRLLFVQRSYPEIFFKLQETTTCDVLKPKRKSKKISPLKNLANFYRL